MQTMLEWLGSFLPDPIDVVKRLAFAIVAGLLFNILFAGFAKRIRRWLSKQTRSSFRRFLRWIYVRIFVGAVRGRPRLAAAYTNVYILLFGSVFLMTSGLYDTLLPDFQQKDTDELFREMRESADQNTQVLDELSRLSSGQHRIAVERLGDGQIAFYIGGPATDFKIGLSYAMVIAGLCLALWVLIRLPFVRYRSQFAYELERFTRRIQGLASKAELAELIEKEVAVKDEKSAEEFVSSMASIAKRHNVGSLVDTFLLWGPPPSEQPAPQSLA